MKKPVFLLLALFLVFTKSSDAQQKIIKTDKEIYTIDGPHSFIITKTDIESKKVLFKTETKIPDKTKKEGFNPLANNIDYEFIGDNMVIVYDVWQKSTSSKECYVKLLNVNTGKLNESKFLCSTKLNSFYSSSEITYKPVYSPDKTKVLVIRDNVTSGYNFDAELKIFDTMDYNILASKTISGRFEDQKRIFDLPNTTMDNDGNISAILHLLNEKTKMTAKSYSAEIPFNEPGLTNLKELSTNASSDAGENQHSHGRFYKTLEDYLNDEPILGVRIKNGSFHWTNFGGTDYKLIDESGNFKKEDTKNLPSDIFTYKKDNLSNPFVIRLIENKPYIVLAVGKLNYYSLYLSQDSRYYSEGWNGELKKFREKDLENYLAKYGILEAYKKDRPKREYKDSVNDYFNKTIRWHIKYFDLINEEM